MRRIEHDGVIYFPAGTVSALTMQSLSDGQWKPVDASGVLKTNKQIDPRIVGDPNLWIAGGEGASEASQLASEQTYLLPID